MLPSKMNNYLYSEDSDVSMELAFRKDNSDKRKEWLYNYNPENILKQNEQNIKVEDFIHKELIHFSNSDTLRSIGSLYDGLKPSQRKILYSCFKRKLYKFVLHNQQVMLVKMQHIIMVSTLIGNYGMAQNYTGSNNINLLMPNGHLVLESWVVMIPKFQVYHTELNKLVDLIYPSIDFDIIDYEYDDGIKVEPKYYVPIIPMILVNGMNGIGTGFSTSIPKYNPIDIIDNIKEN